MFALLWLACSSDRGGDDGGAPRAAQAEPTEVRYAARHVLVAFAGAADADPAVSRSRAEARLRAFDVVRQTTEGATLEALARTTSDASDGARGGFVGVYAPGTWIPVLERVVAALDEGEVSVPVLSPYGWHVLERLAIPEVRLRHIVVGFQGATRSAATRTRAEAEARMADVLADLDGGKTFSEVAHTYSEDASASLGGDLGLVVPGRMVPAFDDVAFALAEGSRSAVFETSYGFHVVERLPR